MISVTGGLAGAPRRIEHLDGLAIFAPEIVEVSDIVIGLRDQPWHAVLFAQLASLLITIQRPRKIVQIDQGHSEVAEAGGHAFPVLVGHQPNVGTLVMGERFLESVLTVMNVAQVYLQTGQTPGIIETRKDPPGTLRSMKRPVVFTEEDQGLDRATERSCGFILIFQRFVKLESLFVVLDRPGVVSAGIEGVCLGPHPESQAFLAPQFIPDQNGCFREVQRLARVHAYSLNDQFCQPLDNFAACKRRVTREKLPTRRIGLSLCELRKEFFRRRILVLWCHQWNSTSDRFRWRRSLHFSHVNPLDLSAS